MSSKSGDWLSARHQSNTQGGAIYNSTPSGPKQFRFGVAEDSSRGKGSHTLFFKQFDDGEFTYPIPTHGKDVNPAYVKGARRKFRLMPEDGVSDDEFFAQV